MGDMADLALEHAELECYPDLRESDPSEHDPHEWWRTQFNGWARIKDMETPHLENTCAMLERNDNQAHPSYFPLVEELEKRTTKA